MAELNTASANARGAKRKSTRVDLTAMVDLAFLLITFFMLTTTLSKPKAMPLAMPVDGGESPVAASRTLTVCLGAHNKALVYRGLANAPIDAPVVVNYGKNGLRRAIVEARQKVTAITGKTLIVVIKPSNHSVYENAVDALDEMNITGIQQYAITDITPADVHLLQQKNID